MSDKKHGTNSNKNIDANMNILEIINKSADMVLLSVLWCVFSLPILTLGASSAALYHVIVKSIRGDTGRTYAGFVQAFRGNLRQSLPVTALSLLSTAAFGGTLYYFYIQEYSGSMLVGVYSIFSLLGLLVTAVIQIHAYALIGRFNLSRRELISVLVRLMGQGFFQNLLCLLLLGGAAAVAIFYPPLLFIIPSGLALALSYVEEPRFSRYIRYNAGDEAPPSGEETPQ